MSRNIRVSEPSAEMQIKIIRAKDAIASQKPGLSGALIADTIQQSSSLRIPEDMCRPNARPADARPSSMFWDEKITKIAAQVLGFDLGL